MDHELVLENCSSVAVYTLPNSITYLKVVKYLNVGLSTVITVNPICEALLEG